MSIIYGVLLAGRFRSWRDLGGMSNEDQRNTLIVELANRTNQPVPFYQRLNDAALAEVGAAYVLLREAAIRSEADLRGMSPEDIRNTLIVELDAWTRLGINNLQSLSTLDLVLIGLGKEWPGDLHAGTYLRGVLLAGRFRGWRDLNGMALEDQRNTLIVELTNRTNRPVPYYQGMNDYALAEIGAAYILLREAAIRSEADLRAMSPEDIRNTLIVELDARTHLGVPALQGLRTLGLVELGLGVDPAVVFQALPGPLNPPPDLSPGPFEFSAPITSGGLAALGGWMKVTVNQDGSVRWQGHAHDSGTDGYDFAVSAVVRTASGRGVAVTRNGHVGGTLTSGSRDYDWDITQPPNAMLAAHLAEFAEAQIEPHTEYSSDIGSALEKAVGWLLRYGIGTVIGPAGGAIVFIGVEVGSLATTGSLIPGARIVGNLLWLAGPANTLFALAAEGIAELGSRTRELSQEEYDWANTQVFDGSLPPRERIVLTDTLGPDKRAFTFPRFDGKITVNLGPDGFDNPRKYRQRGEVFIHELVHACQIQHATLDLALLADAFASKVCEATGGDPYQYGPAGPDYRSFNLEQQAQIVSDWFAGIVRSGTNQTGVAMDMNSPYFRYITGNVRVGRF